MLDLGPLWLEPSASREEIAARMERDGVLLVRDVLSPEEVARATLGLCSGLMDGVKGQILLLDNACGFADNVVRMFTDRERLGLTF